MSRSVKKYEPKDKMQLLVQVAKLYYEQDFNQELISERLGVSRPYISRLLNEAKEMGIVKVQIIDSVHSESALETRLRKVTGISKVTAVPLKKDAPRLQNVCTEAARQLSSTIQGKDIIGYSWGNTIYVLSTLLNETLNFPDMIVTQLCGGIGDIYKNVFSSQIAANFSKAWSAKSYTLPCPAVLDSESLKNALMKESVIQSVLKLGYEANVAVFTVGSSGIQNALCRAGYVSPDKSQELRRAGAVGDICTHIIDNKGNIVDPKLDACTLAVPLEEIKKKNRRILIAEGTSKIDGICGAIRGGFVTELILDEHTAQLVMESLEQLS